MKLRKETHLFGRTFEIDVKCVLFIYELFHDTVSSSDYIASNDRMINE
jgi:hypothetical protein